ncbi:nf-x1 finger transcription factor [Niveomyces insectorum RCEF 264]|uniref:Nf-x1 finger transcription factor n=1 Tax=Niveomyces insectorum RCEF 264 TaxID=1081102 RepID=A0A167LNT6_9HYPO|nr:nf-x1 finger transcription factor [Niveomyces insectorum RCEF 264]
MSTRAPSKVVFVGNIPYGLSEEQISDIFSSAGRVVNFRLVYDREHGKPKGFGFAEYPDADSAASAVRNLNDYEIMGRKLRVDFSNENSSGGGADDDRPTMVIQASPGAPPIGDALAGAAMPSLPPLPSGKDIPAGASTTDEVCRVLRTLPPMQLLDVLSQMKTLAGHDPARATELLAQAPQLAFAVCQALLLMDLVSPEAIQAVVEGLPPGAVGAAAVPTPLGVNPYGGIPGYGLAEGAPMLPIAPTTAVASTHTAPAVPQNPDELIKQVLELPQTVIDQLPEAERTQLIALRMQYGGGRA